MKRQKIIIAHQKNNFFRLIICHYKTFLFFFLSFVVLGCTMISFSYKNAYVSTASIFYRAYAPSSYIAKMSNLANEDIVYQNTSNQLKEDNVCINNSIDYSTEEVKALIQISTDYSLNMVKFSAICKEKSVTQTTCEVFLKNALLNIRKNGLYTNTVLIMNEASSPQKYDNKIVQQLFQYILVGVVIASCNCIIESKISPCVDSITELYNIKSKHTPIFDEKDVSLLKEIQTITSLEDKICIWVDTNKKDYSFLFKELLKEYDNVAIVKIKNKLHKKINDSGFLELRGNNMFYLYLNRDYYTQNDTIQKQLCDRYDFVIWIVENKRSFVDYVSEHINCFNLIYAKKRCSDLNQINYLCDKLNNAELDYLIVYKSN